MGSIGLSVNEPLIDDNRCKNQKGNAKGKHYIYVLRCGIC